MCGIFGVIKNKPTAAADVFSGLKSLEYRGYDSYGILAKEEDGSVFIVKKTGPLPSRIDNLPASHFAFGHTRWATHGGVTDENAHPHADCKKQIFVIHNGIIENFETLREELIKKGHKFISETDTEIIPHLIEDLLKKTELVSATREAFLRLKGLNAVIVAAPHDETFICIKNISPISIGERHGDYYFASDPNAVSEFTTNIHFLEDNNLAVVKSGSLEIFNVKSMKKVKTEFQKYKPITFSEKGQNHAHFMLKEIFEQPEVLGRIIKNREQIKKLFEEIGKSRGTFFIGSGSAGFAGLFGTYVFSREAGEHMNFAFSSEFSYYKDFLNRQSLVVAFSQSGETADVIAAVKAAQGRGSKIAAVTNVFGSSLYRTADIKVLLYAGPERAVLATKSFMAKLAILLILSAGFNGKAESVVKILKQTAEELNKMEKDDFQEKIKSIVKKIYRKNNLFVIGRGANYPLALEGALKIKEGSYLHAEGLAGGELKHGVIALIEEGTPCIVLCPNDETYGDILSNAMELQARGGYMIGIGSRKSEVFDEFIEIKDLEIGSYLLITFVVQLIGYYTAVARGLNPDRPRNLAKSVTVK